MRTVVGDDILTERRGAVLWIVFNRPQARNALTFAMYDRLAELLDEIALDDALRAVVFTGAGDKAFVAGTDINEFKNFTTPEDSLRYEGRMDAILTALERLAVPTIAALRGACTGGGAALASACDLRIGTPSIRFGFPVARTLGNCLSVKNYARLVALVGEGAVKQMLYTAELMGAERAYQLGLLNALVAEDALESEAEALAERIAANAPLTIRVTKEALRRIRADGASAEDTDLIQTCYQSDDFREGMTAFLAKRPAKWTGR